MRNNELPFGVHEGCGITTYRTVRRNMDQLYPCFETTVVNKKSNPYKNSDHLPKPKLIRVDDILGKFIPILDDTWDHRKMRKTRHRAVKVFNNNLLLLSRTFIIVAEIYLSMVLTGNSDGSHFIQP